MTNLTKIEVAWKLHLQGMETKQVAQAVGVHKATVYRWYDGVTHYGNLRAYLKQYQQAKRRERTSRLHPDTVRLVRERRHDKPGLCGQKIVWWLRVKHNITVSVATIYRILHKLGFTLSSKWIKWTKRPPLPQAIKPRAVIQVDKIDCGFLWVHNFIDCYTRETVSVVVDDEGSKSALDAGKLARSYFGPIDWLQSDNGSEYRGHFEKLNGWYQNRRRITPGKKEENGFVESFNRTLRKECVGWGHYLPEHRHQLQDRIDDFLEEYHHERPHLGLNYQTPNQVYLSHLTWDIPRKRPT